MGKTRFGMTMSLGGFVSDRSGDVGSLYPDFAALRHSEALKEVVASTGAVAMGRRTYGMAGGGDWSAYEFRVPIFVLTHRPPARPARPRAIGTSRWSAGRKLAGSSCTPASSTNSTSNDADPARRGATPGRRHRQQADCARAGQGV
jgi:hypothetical protein